MKTKTKKIEDLWPGDRVIFQSKSYRFSGGAERHLGYIVLDLDWRRESWGLMLTGDWSTSVEVEV